MPPKDPKSAQATQHCWYFLNRHCKFEHSGGCPRKHDEALRKQKKESTTKKPRYQNRKALVKAPVVPSSEPETSGSSSTITVRGEWTKSGWWRWGMTNIKTVAEAAIFSDYIDELEAGRVPKALMEKWGKRASKDAEFKCFGILPFEIRGLIWKYALKDQRHTLRLKFSNEWEFGRMTNIKITNHNGYSPMFHVNSQSRQVALKDYEVRFATVHNPAKIYINYWRDRVFFHTKKWDELSTMARYIDPFDASRIRHIELPIRDFICGQEMITCDTLPWFVNMRHLTLFAGDGKEDAKILTPGSVKYHVNGITKCVAASWRKFLPGKPPPKVHFHFIDASLAHYFRIDDLVY